MAARDDSVIRGSLIACLIFLLFSIALNIFFWRWGDTASAKADQAASQLASANEQVRTMENRVSRLKSMIGQGGFTEAEIEAMRASASDDPEMQKIEANYARNMALFGPEVDPSNRNYEALPDYLATAIRSRNEQYFMARTEATKVRTDADADIQNAREAQRVAESKASEANKRASTLEATFQEDRNRINQEKEAARDKLSQKVREFEAFRRMTSEEKQTFEKKQRDLLATIDTQKREINRLRSDNFETVQGEVRYVQSGGQTGGEVVTINLGADDLLRPGVTFGVISAEESRLQDAKVKASVQVTRIEGPHLARARVVGRPEIASPIIPGDKVYSPFWAPGRSVKIALAGEIDIDDDDRPDNSAIEGQIRAAGAEVVPYRDLDSAVRFLVVGDSPNVEDARTLESEEEMERRLRERGDFIAKAGEFGITVIPAWKLDNYLRTIDDSLTTPLGSASRYEDFLPPTRTDIQRLPNEVPSLYKKQDEMMQRNNEIVRP